MEKPHYYVEQETVLVTDTTVRPPSMYRVCLHNDDYTTQEFVVGVLKNVFHKSEPEAVQVMLQVHQRGVGVAGIYPYEIAETKVSRVLAMARQQEFPLQCTLERE